MFQNDLAKKISNDCQVLSLFFFAPNPSASLAPVEKMKLTRRSKSRTIVMPKKCRDLSKSIYNRLHTFWLKF